MVWDACWGFWYGPGQNNHADERDAFADAQDGRTGANIRDAGTEAGGAPRNGTAGEPAAKGRRGSLRGPGLKTQQR